MKLLERLDVVARRRGMAETTIGAYSLWVRQFLAFSAREHGAWKTPEELFTEDVEAFLNDLVVQRRLSASSQNQALNALVFLYKHVLDDMAADHLGKFALLRSRRRPRVPTVLSVDEVRRLLAQVPDRGKYGLMVRLLYGTGMRVSECCTLRIRDIDRERAQIIIRQGKGDKDRVVMLPRAVGEMTPLAHRRCARRRRAGHAIAVCGVMAFMTCGTGGGVYAGAFFVRDGRVGVHDERVCVHD